MSRPQKLSLALAMPATLALVALLEFVLSQPVPPVAASAAPTAFDAGRALADAVTLAQDYPDRVVGSPTASRARAWITARLAEAGLVVDSLPFTVTVASQPRRGEQLWAVSPGAGPDGGAIIVVTAHYDVPETGIPGAADDASGIGAMLELARVFSAEPHRHALLFMASDSEEYGSFWGAQRFLEQFPDRGRIAAVLDLDYLGAGELRRIHVGGAGLWRGYAPLWLREAGRGAIEAAGLPAVEADGLLEIFQRAIPVGTADYSVYLRAGIPAVSFGGEPVDTAAWNAEYHTPQDTPDKLQAPAFAAYGRAAETWVRTLDGLDPLPESQAHYLRLSRARYLSGQAVDLLQVLLFAPLFLATLMAWRASPPRRDELQPEFMAFLGMVVAGLDGYAVAFSLVVLGLLPRYEMYPASPGDPFLLQPAPWAVLVIYGSVALFGWLIFRPFRGWGRLADILEIPHRRLTLLLVFSVLVLILWYINGFAGSALLGLAAYTWPWIEPRASRWGRMLNVVLALAGALPFAAIVYVFTASFPVGPWWWYLPLAAAYGLFPLPAVVLFLCAAGLLVRFIQYGLREPPRRQTGAA